MKKLVGKIQHYAWGGDSFIPQLLGISFPTDKPCAEYWMGAHHNAPSVIEQNGHGELNLNKLIADEPERWLGQSTCSRFGELPYLLKVLDVKEMLSIQVHPTKPEAEKGYACENDAGIPLNAPNRNYKDENHKPEIMLALSEFWLLHGFKSQHLLQQTLQQTTAFRSLLPVFEKEGYYGLYKTVMEMPQLEVDAMLNPLLEQTLHLYRSNRLLKSEPAYWACKALPQNTGEFKNLDRGIFSIYFFNIVQLTPGQAIFQGAGIPHAYLEGQNIELMSNSDNVLRGGLTPKHIDVPELLKHTRFEATAPQILNGEKKGVETFYHCPVPDFELSSIHISASRPYQHNSFSAEIILLTDGAATINASQNSIHLKKGDSVFIGAAETYTIVTSTQSQMYKAAVPESK